MFNRRPYTEFLTLPSGLSCLRPDCKFACNIPPAEAEAKYYEQLNELAMVA
jgi:hypothetical protein